MEMMMIGLESLEAAMNVGSMVVDQLGSLGDMATAGEITCEVSRCEWA